MAEHTVHVRASQSSLLQAIATIPNQATSGTHLTAILTRAGMAILGRIKQAFIVKSRGGTDEAGDRWAPLSPKTIAYRRKGRTSSEKKRDTMPSQALTKKEQQRWWDLYRQGMGMFDGNKASAAKRAWVILKNEGATTLLEKYGTRKVDILRDTGLLLNSLSPGLGGKEQVFRVGNGEVIIGTNRKGARAHHNGIPGKLPQRRLWPEPKKWPATWWKDVTSQIKQGIADIAAQIIKGA